MHRLLTLIGLLLLLSGCAMPISDAGLLEREQDAYANIIEGKTTRAELIAKYGSPDSSYGNSQNRQDNWIKYNTYGLTQVVKSTTRVVYENDVVTSRVFRAVITQGRN